MSISHALSGEAIDVLPYGNSLPEQRTVALFKSDQLEVMRLVLAAGKTQPTHRVAGELTVQCLEGEIEVEAYGDRTLLRAGQLLFLHGDVPHSMHARTPASALVSMVLCK